MRVRPPLGTRVASSWLSVTTRLVRPLSARPAAASGDARLVGIEELLDRVDVCRGNAKRLKDHARTRARLHEAVDDEKALRRVAGVFQLTQSGVRQMDIGEAIIALTPGFRRTFDIAEHRRRDRLAISG